MASIYEVIINAINNLDILKSTHLDTNQTINLISIILNHILELENGKHRIELNNVLAKIEQAEKTKNIAKVKKNGLKLQNITNQTPAICLAAVQQNGKALQYVNKQT